MSPWPPFEYDSLWQMLDIRQGGIAIYGAIIGAFLFGGLAARWRQVPLLPLFDAVGMGFLIGQGIGRWGNFVNQEAFGTNTTLPWGMFSEGTQHYLASVQGHAGRAGRHGRPQPAVHPTFLYESLWCLAGFLALFFYMKRRRFNGQLFLLYVIWYGLGRYWIEGLRTDSLLIGGTDLRFSQLVALVSVAAAAVLLVYGLQRSKGRALQVTLAVSDLKKLKQAGARFCAGKPARLGPAQGIHRRHGGYGPPPGRARPGRPGPNAGGKRPGPAAGPEADPQEAPEEKEDDDEREDH